MTSTATTDRTQKLKDARNEASKEIEQLKSKKEQEFKDSQKEVSLSPPFHSNAVFTVANCPV